MERKIKILIVEDNEDERLFLKEGFIQSGLYEIVGEAENGKELLELLTTSSFPLPDIVLSDLKMPGKDGYEVIMDIKADNFLSHIQVVILTTAPFIPFAERCKNLGASAYFTKPETFLEYKKFAEDIYGDLKACLDNAKLNYSGIEKLKERLLHGLFGNCLPVALLRIH